MAAQTHWENIYGTKAADAVSWYRPHLETNDTKISGTIPTTLSDFKIDPPSLLTMPVKNEIPVRVEMTWHPQ